jgi:nitrate reductase delta subunit
MQPLVDLHDLAAGLFFYPDAEYGARVERCRREFTAALPQTGEFLVAFADSLEKLAPEQVEELFTRTFELNPLCALEVGWHLFGENYSRGEFLVQMRQQLRRHNLPESTELPDHLGHVLPILARLPDEESGPFAAQYVLPALDKMLVQMAGKENPFEQLLQAVRRLAADRRTPVTPRVDRE